MCSAVYRDSRFGLTCARHERQSCYIQPSTIIVLPNAEPNTMAFSSRIANRCEMVLVDDTGGHSLLAVAVPGQMHTCHTREFSLPDGIKALMRWRRLLNACTFDD